jgi:hypothetical protein
MQEIVRKNVKVCTQNVVIQRQNCKPQQLDSNIVVHKKVVNLERTPQKALKQISEDAEKSQPNVNVTRNTRGGSRKVIKREPPKISYVTKSIDERSRLFISKIRNVGCDRVLVIIGNGPSILEADLPRLKNLYNVDLLTVNKPDMRVWPTTYWAFCDMSQYRRNTLEWDSYQGIIINSTAVHRQKHNSFQIKNLGGYGFSLDLLRGYHIGRSTVYASMQAGLWMGYNRIYIFGCDMNPNGIDGKLHFYGVNPDVEPDKRASRFEAEAEYYYKAAEILPQDVRDRFYFCSTYNNWPFVDFFNREDHTTVIDSIIDYAAKISKR